MKRNTKFILFLTGLVGISSVCVYLFMSSSLKRKDNIESYYYPVVAAETAIPLYDESHQVIGELEASTAVALDPFSDDEYFKVTNSSYYVYYKDVKEAMTIPYCYPKPAHYIPFNKQIATTNPVTLYSLEGVPLYSFNHSIEAVIIIQKESYYVVEWNQNLYQILPDNVSEINILAEQISIAKSIPVFMYHFFYDASAGETARDGNWLDVAVFEEHIAYLTENNYVLLTMSDLEMFLKGEIQLPKKSVVITIDDGDPSVYQYAYPVLEKYHAQATTFLITSWYEWDIENRWRDHIELHSHSHNMHRGGCPSGKGGILLCIGEENGIEDLTTSRTLLSDSFVFCYPFGDVNQHAKDLLTKAGFRLAFTTKYGLVGPGMDLLELPRVRISSGTTLKAFIQLLPKY